MNVKLITNVAIQFIKKNAPMILASAGAAGVVVTAVLTAKEMPKAQKLLEERKAEKNYNTEEGEPEKELTVWEKTTASVPPMVPAIISGAASIACIFAGQKINAKRLAMLAGVIALKETQEEDLKKAMEKVLGEKKIKEIEARKSKDVIDQAVANNSYEVARDVGDGKQWFCFTRTGDLFKATLSSVQEAEKLINRKIENNKDSDPLYGISLNEFTEFIVGDERLYKPAYDYLGFMDNCPVDISYGPYKIQHCETNPELNGKIVTGLDFEFSELPAWK